ncbi:MAG: lipid IV(A) 3-deoxy-D-manno-octulosonic acid transferase [Gammaproteobacteria bacterium]
MRLIYTAILYLLTPLVMLRLLWRSRADPDYRRRWPERFGFGSTQRRPGAIWVHAVSVGEVQAAVPLIRSLRECDPALPLVVTTTTPTGSRHVRRVFGQDVIHVYIPYDLPGAVRRFLRRVRPRLLIVMETEIWPNLYHWCRRADIPVVLANARLSERSAAGYARVPGLVRDTLDCLAAIAPQSQLDAARLLALGADPRRVSVTGNLKFDVRLPASLLEQAQALRRALGTNRAVWIAASTHEGEDEQVLKAHAAVRERIHDALLVLVPRHPERFARVAALCRRLGYATVVRSAGGPCLPRTAVFLCDTMGELPAFYGASDLAFVGGSLAPAGGHNLLEPAALGVPVLTGPHMDNFLEVTELMLQAGAARTVDGSDALAGAVTEWLQNAPLRHRAGEQGRALVERNRGSLERLLAVLAPYLD